MSRLLIVVFLFSNISYAKEQSENVLPELIKDMKRSVLVKGENIHLAVKKLSENMALHSISFKELDSYVKNSSTLSEYLDYKKKVSFLKTETKNIKELDEESLNYLVSMTMNSTTNKGSNFLGCTGSHMTGAMLGFIAVGLLVDSILRLASDKYRTKVSDIGHESWDDFRSERAGEHAENLNGLQDEISGYEATITEFSTKISLLQHEISTNSFSSRELDEIEKNIRDFKFQITDAEALIAETQVDIDYYSHSYEAQIERSYDWEKNDQTILDENKKSGKILLGAAIASAGLSTWLFVEADCGY